MPLSLVVVAAVFVAIAIRQWLPARLRIWHLMTAGAVVVLAAGELSPEAAVAAVDWNVIAYLFAVFSIAAALERAGVPRRLASRLFTSRERLLGGLLSLMGLAAAGAAFLTNDAIAVIGAPLALAFARTMGCRPALPLIALCVAVTIGSMATPVGNPQNILIAGHAGPDGTLAVFLGRLGVPAAVSLGLAALWLWLMLRREGTAAPPSPPAEPPEAPAWPAQAATALLVALVVADGVVRAALPGHAVALGAIGLAACLPVYLAGPRRLALLRAVDWPTLVFFVAMFVVTGAVLRSGAIEQALGPLQARLDDPPVLAMLSFWGSQLFSNVPLVQIYLGLLTSTDPETMMLLAATSTLAGNLFVISAASNVIVVQQAERLGVRPFQFWEFALVCLPVTAATMAITYAWIVWGPG